MQIERMATLAALAVLAVLPAGCGDDDATSTTAPTTPTTLAPGASTTTPAEPFADLQIRYEHPDADVSFEYGIECRPETSELTGDAARAEIVAFEACELLTTGPEVADRLVDGPDDDVCTEQYGGPDTAEISGTLFDQEVDTVVDRTNGCGIADWDELLAELLPPAIGVTPPATG